MRPPKVDFRFLFCTPKAIHLKKVLFLMPIKYVKKYPTSLVKIKCYIQICTEDVSIIYIYINIYIYIYWTHFLLFIVLFCLIEKNSIDGVSLVRHRYIQLIKKKFECKIRKTHMNLCPQCSYN